MTHRLALVNGHEDAARMIEDKLRGNIERWEKKKAASPTYYRGSLLHMQGIRAVTQGEYKKAAKLFRKADEEFKYWGEGEGFSKLYNRLALALALDEAGSREEAEAVMRQVMDVNPFYATNYELLRISLRL